MAEVTVKKIVNAPAQEVFQTWHKEYAHMYKFNPNLLKSYLINNSPSEYDIGALRHCDLADGKNWLKEKITQVIPNKLVAIEIYDTSMPIKSCRAETKLNPIGRNQTEVSFTIYFVPKMGFLGKIMLPMMKTKFKSMMNKVLEGNKAYVETGKQVIV